MKSWYGIQRISLILSLFLLLLVGGVPMGRAATGLFWNNDIAIRGYDPVSYFNEGRPVKGNESYSFTWHGLTWYFVSKEDKDLFTKNPAKYAPQYDGYCSWAMTMAQKASTDPEVWKIVNGKLYLNCSRASFRKWSKDIPGNIEKADRNWKKLTGEK